MHVEVAIERFGPGNFGEWGRLPSASTNLAQKTPEQKGCNPGDIELVVVGQTKIIRLFAIRV